MSDTWPCSLAVSEELLAAHVHALALRGYVGLTLSEAERRRQAGTLPIRSVVITFDDGYLSTLKARPILEQVGFPATVFVVPPFVDSGGPLCWDGIEHWAHGPHAHELRSLAWAELESLRDAGWEIGSHTLTHPRLVNLPRAALQNELRASREAIESRLGRCESLAYPYGLANDTVAQAASEAGYLVACTLSTADPFDEPMRRPRVGLYPGDTGWRARAKLSPTVLALRRSRAALFLERARASLLPG